MIRRGLPRTSRPNLRLPIGVVSPRNAYRRWPRKRKFPRVLPLPEAYQKRDKVVSLTPTWTTNYHSFNGTVETGPGTNDLFGGNWVAIDQFSGQTNPWWKDEVRNGQNATTTASGTRTDFVVPFFSIEAESNNFKMGSARQYHFAETYGYAPIGKPALVNPSTNDINEVHNRVIRKLVKTTGEIRGSTELLQDLGEYHQVIGSMMHPLTSLRKHVVSYFSNLRKVRNRYRTAASLQKALSDTYLEWTYGWNPLVSDIASAYVDITSFRDFDSVPFNVHAHKDFSGSTSFGSISVGSAGIYTAGLQTKITSSYTERFKGAIKTGAVNRKLPVLQSLQLTPKFWAPSAWDLLPYSFIADYFVNVGDVIQSACYCFADIAWGCRTTRTVTTYDYVVKATQIPRPPGEVWTRWRDGSDSHGYAQITSFTRAAMSPSDILATFRFSLPLSGKPWLNMYSLMLSNAKGLSPFY